jgi:serine/threonine-protein kinase SRPK3
VALKILTADAPRHECAVLQKITKRSQFAGAQHIIQMLDYFELNGPHGNHLCLVLELLSQSVLVLCEGFKDQPDVRLSLVKRISNQVLQGVDFLERACGLMHNGKYIFSIKAY